MSNVKVFLILDVVVSESVPVRDSKHVTLRNMTREDADFAGKLYAEAFRGKITHAVGSNEQ